MLAGTTVLSGDNRGSDQPPWLSTLCVSLYMIDLISAYLSSSAEVKTLSISYINGGSYSCSLNLRSSLHQILLTGWPCRSVQPVTSSEDPLWSSPAAVKPSPRWETMATSSTGKGVSLGSGRTTASPRCSRITAGGTIVRPGTASAAQGWRLLTQPRSSSRSTVRMRT